MQVLSGTAEKGQSVDYPFLLARHISPHFSYLFMWLLLHFYLFHAFAKTGLHEDRQPTVLPTPPARSHTFPWEQRRRSHSSALLSSATGGQWGEAMPCRLTGSPRSCSEDLTLPRQAFPLPGTLCASLCCPRSRRDAPAVPFHVPSYRQAGTPAGTSHKARRMPRVLVPACPWEVVVAPLGSVGSSTTLWFHSWLRFI